MRYDIAVVGGGPAGCAVAITAARSGKQVLLCERGRYPRHRVCGEFVSPESHSVLVNLLATDHKLVQTAPFILQARMFVDGKCLQFALPQPAWSISRHELDLALWNVAECAGADCRQSTTVESMTRNSVVIHGRELEAAWVINASGRWSNLRRSSLADSGPRWIAVKAHFIGENAPPSTDIYFFEGGYCGVQPVVDSRINVSAMVRADVGKSLQEVFAAHPELWLRSRAWDQVTETVTTSPLIHSTPQAVTDGIMNTGDAAAFIDPFTGDGISLALRSGVLAAQCAIDGGQERYAREYEARFSRAFQAAAFTRHLSRAPEAIRRIASFAFRSELVKKWALQQTRGI